MQLLPFNGLHFKALRLYYKNKAPAFMQKSPISGAKSNKLKPLTTELLQNLIMFN